MSMSHESALPQSESASTPLCAFDCNLCGDNNLVPFQQIEREIRSCKSCGSTVRMRELGWVLSRELFGENLLLPQFPRDKGIRGMGLSDPTQLAMPLMDRLDYRNTLYDGEPFLDILDISRETPESYDFIISSEVFEHIAPPIMRAFENLYTLLKPGGVVVFSVPYTPTGETREHFPRLHDYRIDTDERGEYLINRTREGVIEVFRELTFHPGRGETLEMRFFSFPDLSQCFKNAGFEEVTVWHEPFLPFGIDNLASWGRILSVRKAR